MSPMFYLHRQTFLTEKAEGGNIRAIFREIHFSLFQGKWFRTLNFPHNQHYWDCQFQKHSNLENIGEYSLRHHGVIGCLSTLTLALNRDVFIPDIFKRGQMVKSFPGKKLLENCLIYQMLAYSPENFENSGDAEKIFRNFVNVKLG